MTKEETTQYLALSGDNPSDKEILDTLLYKKQIVLTGVPGVGKSRYTNLLKNSGEFAETEMVQFHANYSYEDLIGSETLTANDQNATIVSTQIGWNWHQLKQLLKGCWASQRQSLHLSR